MRAHVHTSCTHIFITALFVIGKNWKQFKCSSSTSKWIFKKYDGMSICYPAIKRHELLVLYMRDSQNNYAEWKKPAKKNHILSDLVYIKFQKVQTNVQCWKVY